MTKIDKKTLKQIANDLLIDADDDVIESIIQEFSSIKRNFDLIKSINVDNVEPMFQVDENPTSWLREDIEAFNYLKKSQILKNAARKNDDYVIIKKVVK
ncbi:Asp-tRNA(Asn)/Glu-tRNA(Gln) amidotransferase subunit GatC [Mycoplasma elephantis]|uniref:Asp-tRNA(Asn)/Glu-tRNA(Gln) amidotransferase subunit GatC n=1 Tax=Mycoplasma elephantis TaxID=114882 RepID=UPI0004826FC3|nr:Asp-tRNA(Asn)/Glu-tRNA(Gln) amidotransferase subunit GatC [Mycoplasma elephantis]